MCVPGALPDNIVTIDAPAFPQSMISTLLCCAFSCSGDSEECDGGDGYVCCECTSCQVIVLPDCCSFRFDTWGYSLIRPFQFPRFSKTPIHEATTQYVVFNKSIRQGNIP